jgi:putative tryptophan/tyrosine transport system substrate-binding protein
MKASALMARHSVLSLALSVLVLIFALHVSAKAQQPTAKTARIGYLGNEQSPAATPREEAFLKGLRDHGWIEGQNLLIERRYWENRAARLPGLADELVRLNLASSSRRPERQP